MKRRANPPSLHPPLGAYTHQIEISDERLLVIAGQVGMTVDGSVPQTAAEQLAVALQNIVLNLEAAGMSTSDLVKLNYFLTEEIPREERAAIIQAALGDEPAAATLVYVSGLAAPHLKVEVEALASAP